MKVRLVGFLLPHSLNIKWNGNNLGCQILSRFWIMNARCPQSSETTPGFQLQAEIEPKVFCASPTWNIRLPFSPRSHNETQVPLTLLTMGLLDANVAGSRYSATLQTPCKTHSVKASNFSSEVIRRNLRSCISPQIWDKLAAIWLAVCLLNLLSSCIITRNVGRQIKRSYLRGRGQLRRRRRPRC